MPYDPDWDLEEEVGTGLNTPDAAPDQGSLSSEHDLNGMPAEGEGEEEEQQGDYAQDDMEVDLPGSNQLQYPGQNPDAIPRKSLPFPGAAAAGKLPQVAVVLHSSPRRVSFTAPADELADDFDGETSLVTSGIVPQPRIQHEQLAAKPQAAPPKPQPAVAPFPIPTITPQPKKRGRPVGWRLGHGSYSALRAGLLPGSATPRPKPKKPTSEQKVRRRPGRKPAPTARQLYLKLNPHFVAFRCEWENCPAELQNLETLRKHLLVVHGRPPRPTSSSSSSSPPPQQQPLACKWATCTHPPLPSRDSFAAHLETAHLLPYLWHVGDGPRNSTPTTTLSLTTTTTTTTTTATTLPRYLFNALGEQVTPSVHTQQVENEDDRKKRQARINRVLRLRDQNAPEEPEYTARELEIIGEVVGAKRARKRMFREYAERVCGGGGVGAGVGGGGWRP
ncbi:hypothetical protein C8A01DRAFT_17762 [Parachaetomium inaequale]|uniref:C2H2-type domain-containing protein n=1 Tax=Parachaetomium inaequale TaxID=2588326 RepID=A0AAN6PF40_9PEZI|nr:hypothetical protein C8A01DRAFT_17762 [Parachaetomium inaequale]